VDIFAADYLGTGPANRLLHNNADGTFSDVTQESGAVYEIDPQNRPSGFHGSETFDFDILEPGAAQDVGGEIRCVATGSPTACLFDGQQYADFDGDGTTDFEFSDRDFNVVSLRGNAVLRWEYRPGSTLYLVWQQRRYDRRDFGDFAFDRDAADMWTLQPDNILIVKLDYWLGL